LTTVYGSTGFRFHQVLDTNVTDGYSLRATYVTEPESAHQLFYYLHETNVLASNAIPPSVTGQTFDDGSAGGSHYTLDYRNTFQWGRRQFSALSSSVRSQINTNLPGALAALTANDFRKGALQHWLVGSDGVSITESLSSERDPSPDAGGTIEAPRMWYTYPNKPSRETEGDVQITCMARRLPEGSNSYSIYNYYSSGYPATGDRVSSSQVSYSKPDNSIGELTNWFW